MVTGVQRSLCSRHTEVLNPFSIPGRYMLLLLFADDGTKPEKVTGKMRRTPRTGQSRGGPGGRRRTAASALGHAPCCI